MNREIKFRAWNSLQNRYDQRFPLELKDFGDLGYTLTHKDNGFIFQQYTGLKDKNGKEIYEGDIIENNDYKWKITWEEGCVYLKGIGDTKGKWWIGTENGYSEIIGNIYENPELINPNE